VHELAVCQSLIDQVERIALEKGASRADRILLSIGPLSGIEPELLIRAFSIAKSGTIAENARLEIETGEVIVACRSCGASGVVPANRLLCPSCDGWQVNLKSGDEMLLLSLEVSGIEKTAHE
jgi:hydrogenase nickel incorporation protein HypA/HybF